MRDADLRWGTGVDRDQSRTRSKERLIGKLRPDNISRRHSNRLQIGAPVWSGGVHIKYARQTDAQTLAFLFRLLAIRPPGQFNNLFLLLAKQFAEKSAR